MASLKVIEEYDGRLPVYNVVDVTTNIVVKTFDSLEDAKLWCDNNCGILPCGEEDPTL